jgi:hypothetical protein
MAHYFSPFPTAPYKFPSTSTVTVTDITRRFTLMNLISASKIVYDEYYVQDGERPDTVAWDYYNDTTLDWVVLLANEIQDPYFQWVLSDEQFRAYMIQKYGTLSDQYQTVHHYEWIISPQTEYAEGEIVNVVPEKTLVIDYAKYITLAAYERKIVTVYDYEFIQNERRRQIFLFDVNFVDQIRDSHKTIFTTGNIIR